MKTVVIKSTSNSEPTITLRNKKYAENAYGKVAEMRADKSKLSDSDYKEKRELEAEYRTQALNLPTMILQSGLAQAVGFLMAKSKIGNEGSATAKQKAFQILLGHLENLLNKNLNGESLNQVILKSNITEYQTLTRNALEASSWLKRYTQALLRKKGENDD